MTYHDEDSDRFPADRDLIYGKLDYEALKNSISENGPIEVSHPETGLFQYFNISPCQCGAVGCQNDVVIAGFSHGVAYIQSAVEKDYLVSFATLAEFLDYFFHFPDEFFSSTGEEQFIEREIRRILKIEPFDVYESELSAEAIMSRIDPDGISQESFWEAHTLATLLRCLHRKRDLKRSIERSDLNEIVGLFGSDEIDNSVLLNLMSSVFDLGFLSGRLLGEYRNKIGLEDLVIKGERSTKTQAVRTAASGSASAKKRLENLECFMVEIENIGSHFPTFSEEEIVSRAFLNARLVRAMPKSRKTRDDYEVTLRSEEPFKSRYQRVFQKNA